MASVISSDNVAVAFGTPVSTYVWQDSDALNAELAAAILDRERRDPGASKSNIGGWHSDSDLLTWPGDAVATLKDRMSSMSGDLITMARRDGAAEDISLSIAAWANVSRSGNYNNIHDHPSAVWSGVYYVAPGRPVTDDPANGRLELIDPRPGISMVDPDYGVRSGRFLIEPIAGLMVMFPSWLKHMVHPFVGEGERISIAFNVRIAG